MAGSVLTQHLSTGSHTYVCVWTRWDIGCVKADVLSICQFYFILIYIWFKQYVPKYSSDKVTQFKVREKVSGSAAYVSVKFN